MNSFEDVSAVLLTVRQKTNKFGDCLRVSQYNNAEWKFLFNFADVSKDLFLRIFSKIKKNQLKWDYIVINVGGNLEGFEARQEGALWQSLFVRLLMKAEESVE